MRIVVCCCFPMELLCGLDCWQVPSFSWSNVWHVLILAGRSFGGLQFRGALHLRGVVLRMMHPYSRLCGHDGVGVNSNLRGY